MLDLDGDVVTQVRPFPVERFHDVDRVPRTVEEVGITKRDVLRACGHLPADILEHHLGLHHAKRPAIHRHDRTVPAQVLAAAREASVYPARRVEPFVTSCA
jgi:hypothetical protein